MIHPIVNNWVLSILIGLTTMAAILLPLLILEAWSSYKKFKQLRNYSRHWPKRGQ